MYRGCALLGFTACLYSVAPSGLHLIGTFPLYRGCALAGATACLYSVALSGRHLIGVFPLCRGFALSGNPCTCTPHIPLETENPVGVARLQAGGGAVAKPL